MKGLGEVKSDLIRNSGRKQYFGNLPTIDLGSVSSGAEQSTDCCKQPNFAALWSGIWPRSLPIFCDFSCGRVSSESNTSTSSGNNRGETSIGKNYYDSWRAAIRRVIMSDGSMRRIWGFGRKWSAASKGDIWILGVCYQVAQESDDSSDPTQSEGFAAFVEDFSSRIWITYRKGFPPIGGSKYCSDASWGCMLRSSQMLVAQAFLILKLGRSWRKSLNKPFDNIEILRLFGDSEDSPCSIHNLLQSGKAYGLAPGSWIGPYATCRAWECLVQSTPSGVLATMMAVYVVSGDENGESGGAPVLCIEDISKQCSLFSGGHVNWTPILLFVPLVLGLEKVNPRYIPLLSAIFTFPQSLGILGGRPGASTYIVGVQDEKAFYLDPHEVQQAVDLEKDDADSGISSYHCNVVRHMPLESIDSSLAIGFLCRDKSDFDDFCSRASQLIKESNGAPLFTIAKTCSPSRAEYNHSTPSDGTATMRDYNLGSCEQQPPEDDWQLV